MDLRSINISHSNLETIRRLVGETHFVYQPFVFADDLEVGIGYESISNQPGAGMVYWPGAPLDRYPLLKRFMLKDTVPREAFSDSNAKLRAINNHYVDQVCLLFGDMGNLSIADIGCFAGYYPVSFSLHGAGEAVGYDIYNRAECFDVLNRLLDTRAKFIHAGNNINPVPTDETYDIVICHDVVQHMVEPLRFIRSLSRVARQALFLKCPCWLDDTGEFYVTLGEPFGIFSDSEFPWCFDHNNFPSWALLEKALRLCGFKRMVAMETLGFPLPQPSGTRQLVTFSFMAMRD